MTFDNPDDEMLKASWFAEYLEQWKRREAEGFKALERYSSAPWSMLEE